MEDLNKFRRGEMRGIIRPWQNSDKGKYVVTGPIMGNFKGIIGRVVQVRTKTGAYGSDTVLIRESNGNLSTHENQMFWMVPELYYAELDEAFKGVIIDDADTLEYTICGKDPVTGFLS